MGYVLLVVNAEEAVRDVVVYFLLIVFECLDQSNMCFHSLRRLLELAKLLLEGVEGRFESVVWKVIGGKVVLDLDSAWLLASGWDLHEIKVFLIILENLKTLEIFFAVTIGCLKWNRVDHVDGLEGFAARSKILLLGVQWASWSASTQGEIISKPLSCRLNRFSTLRLGSEFTELVWHLGQADEAAIFRLRILQFVLLMIRVAAWHVEVHLLVLEQLLVLQVVNHLVPIRFEILLGLLQHRQLLLCIALSAFISSDLSASKSSSWRTHDRRLVSVDCLLLDLEWFVLLGIDICGLFRLWSND